MLRATTACTFSTSQLPKVVRTPGVFNILTSKCASRHNGVHFFDISTSKSGLRPSVFYTFDFEMCFAPQQRALFHLSSGQLAPHPPLYCQAPGWLKTFGQFLVLGGGGIGARLVQTWCKGGSGRFLCID